MSDINLFFFLLRVRKSWFPESHWAYSGAPKPTLVLYRPETHHHQWTCFPIWSPIVIVIANRILKYIFVGYFVKPREGLPRLYPPKASPLLQWWRLPPSYPLAPLHLPPASRCLARRRWMAFPVAQCVVPGNDAHTARLNSVTRVHKWSLQRCLYWKVS